MKTIAFIGMILTAVFLFMMSVVTVLVMVSVDVHASTIHVQSFPAEEPKIKYEEHSAEVLFPSAKHQPQAVTIFSDDTITGYEVKYAGFEQEYFFSGKVLQLFFPPVKSAIHIELEFAKPKDVPLPAAVWLLGSALLGVSLISRRGK